MAIKGFSLLEVMLVVLVLGIVAGMVTLNYQANSNHRNPDEVLDGLVDWCNLMRQESVLREQALTVDLSGKTAQFFAYDPDHEKWGPVKLPHYFSPDILSQANKIRVQTSDPGDPGPIFLPNGRLRAFTITAIFSDGLQLGMKGSSEGQCIKL